MFGRARATPEVPAQGGDVSLGLHTEIALVANPDTVNIDRQRALVHRIGVGLQGYSGTAVGYDKGDPAMSLTHIIDTAPSPAAAIARIGRVTDAAAMAPPPEFSELLATDPGLNAYRQAQWVRAAR